MMMATASFGLLGCTSTGSSVDTVSLSAVSDSGETGTATLTSLGDSSTQITLTTTGGTDTGVQSAVMRSGSCGSDGTIFAQLNNLQGQSSVTTIDSELSSLTGDKYYIDVQSSTNVDTIEACGEVP